MIIKPQKLTSLNFEGGFYLRKVDKVGWNFKRKILVNLDFEKSNFLSQKERKITETCFILLIIYYNKLVEVNYYGLRFTI